MTTEDRSFRYQSDLSGAELDTMAVRAGQVRSDEAEHSEAIFTTSSYVFSSASEAAARFSGEQPGNVYSRYMNPTVRTFEQRLAAMECAELAVATSSGMAAIFSTLLALLKPGDHLVSSRSIFGSTNVMFEKYVRRCGIDISYVDLKDMNSWESAVNENTRMFFLESPSNPLAELADIQALSILAKKHDALLVVDNCFCTPALQKPILLGADLVIHSATKYIDGQGRCMGGVVAGAEPLITEIVGVLRSVGPTMSPFNAWVFLKGLETLRIRMEAHSASAMKLARWLEKEPKVEKVFYAGLESHPQHELAKKQQSAFGGVLSFVVKGGQEAAWAVIDGTRMISITANLGDTKTTVTHPATTTHGRLSEQEREAAGIDDGFVRIVVGLEDVGDIQ
jgi:O-succinylhomoserine sulfhydrylase